MNSQRVINWGIIGCGNIADKFAKDLSSVPHAQLYAVASRNHNKATTFGKTHGAVKFYGSYTELAEDRNIDVVYIATPHTYHFEHTMMCLQKNIAVLCEKPFAMNMTQVNQMIEMAKLKNIFLMEALWSSFLPHYDFVCQYVQQKRLGEIKELHIDFGFIAEKPTEHRLVNKDLGGGSLLDIGIYPLFFALTLLGVPDNVKANASFFANGIDSTCRMQLAYENGVSAYLYSSLIENTPCVLRLVCEQGELNINKPFHAATSVTVVTKNNSTKDNSVNDVKDQDELLFEFPRTTHGYNYEAIHVQKMLYENRIESTIMPFEKSIQLITLLDKVRSLIDLKY